MTVNEFDQIDQFALQLEEYLEGAMEAGKFRAIQNQMRAAMQKVDPQISLQVKVKVELVHAERENSLRLSSMGYEVSGGREDPISALQVEPLFEGATIHKYFMRGQIYKAPHDHCPNCWAYWPDKMNYRQCSYCHMKMGRDIKQMIDNGLCPHCEKGKISFDHPTCPLCNRTVDTQVVYWG